MHIDSENTTSNVTETKIKVMQPLLVLAPFVGYLAAYLMKLGKAAYFRIPTDYVSVGLEDALTAGCFLIILSVVAMSFYEYLVNYAAWRWCRRPNKRIPRLVNRSTVGVGAGPNASWERVRLSEEIYVDRLGPLSFVKLAKQTKDYDQHPARCFFSMIVYIAVTLAICILGLLLVVWLFICTYSMFSNSHEQLGGHDALLVYVLLFGWLSLLFFIFFLYFSLSGRHTKEIVIPGGFGGLKYKHLIVGLAVIVVLGLTCFVSGYENARSFQSHLINESNSQAIIDLRPSEKMVIGEGYFRSSSEFVLTGNYYFASLPEGITSDSEAFRWKNCYILPETAHSQQ